MLLLIGINTISIAQEASPSRKPFIVVIDPGHGGIDSGALSRNGIMEKDIVLSIALKIDSLSRNFYNKGLELYLTRYSDTMISLRDRTRLAKQLKADVFISLHCNSSMNEDAAGSEVYIYPKSIIETEKSARLGLTIQKGLANLLGIKNRGLRFGNFQVLRDLQNCKSILLELGYLSNEYEATYLSQEKSQKMISLLIFENLIDITIRRLIFSACQISS